MTNPNHTDTSRSGDLMDDDFAPIWDESILLAEHEAVRASVAVGGWLSAALDDPNVCDAMKADINRWFSAGFLYLDEVRKLMQTEREALEAEVERLIKAGDGDAGLIHWQGERIQKLETALREIARLRTDLRGDFSLGSKQSDIARAALGEKQ